MLKKILSVILAAVLLLAFASAFAEGTEKTAVRLGGLKGPTSMGMVNCWRTMKTA